MYGGNGLGLKFMISLLFIPLHLLFLLDNFMEAWKEWIFFFFSIGGGDLIVLMMIVFFSPFPFSPFSVPFLFARRYSISV